MASFKAKEAAARGKVILSRDTPSESADQFRALKRPHIISHQEEWLDYSAGAYRTVEDATIGAEIKSFAEAAFTISIEIEVDARGKERKRFTADPFNPKPRDIESIVTMLRHSVHKPRDTMAPPCFLDGGTGEYAGLDPLNLISFQNGILDINSREKYAPTPQFFTLNALPIDYDPSAPEPYDWYKFLKQVTNSRTELVDLIQERMGYIISADMKQQRVFFLQGPPRSGKGTLMNVTEALVGSQNTASASIKDLATNFGRQSMIGMRYEKVTDMDTNDPQALSSAANFINAVSGLDTVEIQRKFIDAWKGKLRLVIEMASNNLPDFGSHTPAMAARLIIIPFDVSFLGREDRELDVKLCAELPGIVNWALDGLDRLRERGKFVEPRACLDIKRTLLNQSNPLAGFIVDWCKQSPKSSIDKQTLFAEFSKYVSEVDGKGLTYSVFCKKLTEGYPTIRTAKPRRGGDRAHLFVGIRLTDERMMQTYEADADLVELGFGLDALKRDAGGALIPKTSGADEFGAGA